MILSLLYVICWVAPSMGRKERARLGVIDLSEEDMRQLTDITDPDTLLFVVLKLCFQCYLNHWINHLVSCWLFQQIYCYGTASSFAVGTCIALMVNYPVLKDQSKRIGDNAGDAVQVVILVFAAGIFMGLFKVLVWLALLHKVLQPLFQNNWQVSGVSLLP